MKKAVILFNLGGPDSPQNVKPFLYNLFRDPAIITLPQPFRFMLAVLISTLRNKKAQKIYAQIGGKSPILELTNAQATALEKELGEGYKVFVCMRYWHPMAREVAERVKKYAPDEIILLPLYPQYSTTTTASSFKNFREHYGEANYKEVCCYPTDEKFIQAHVSLMKDAVKNNTHARVLFSAHGLPKKVIEKGDPYEFQIQQTSAEIAKRLDIKDWVVCYQSKVGRMEWLGPSTENEIIAAAVLGKDIILTPIAFVSEHSETLVELDIQFKELAVAQGIKNYTRIPALGTHPLFIESLAELTRKEKGQKICPLEFCKCGYEN